MRKILITVVPLFFVYASYSQVLGKGKKNNVTTYEFFEIKIQGIEVSHTKSITLQREGLIYWADNLVNWGEDPSVAIILPEEGIFIPSKELDGDKIIKIMNYICNQKLHEIEKLPEMPEKKLIYSDSTKQVFVQTFSNSNRRNFVTLRFINNRTDKYVSYTYKYCDERIDTLIQMMNDLIPKGDRKRFAIRCLCEQK